jgi:hypothetical protein
MALRMNWNWLPDGSKYLAQKCRLDAIPGQGEQEFNAGLERLRTARAAPIASRAHIRA